ncbi:MAG: lactate utilization protein [Oscillospiraceae bacterium]
MADLEKTRKNLENRGFRAHVFATGAEAADYLAQTLHNTCIGIGGSVTIDEIGVYDRLSADNDVIWRWKKPTPDSRERGAAAETFLCSANGVSETGEIVNIDGYGNRVAPTSYGPQRVFLVVGKNKIAPDLNGAIDRARNIAAPLNARRLNRHTPCAVGEPRCHDCRSPEKICGVMTVFFMPPTSIKEFHVLLVNEDLGY